MATGWQEIQQKTYYFGDSGEVVIGWRIVDGERYYFADDGAMLTGWQELGGIRYCFDEEGHFLTGWHTVDEKLYYFTDAGKTLTGWQTLEEKACYFTDEGYALIGWQTLDGQNYYFSEDGYAHTGWLQEESATYYLNEKGQPLTGWQTVEEKQYYFADNGAMTVGWLSLDGDRYYFRENGVMAVGEVTIDGVKSFFTSKGKYVLLVNHKVPVPADFRLNLVWYQGAQIHQDAKDPLDAMINACKAAGHSLWINNIYRNASFQQYLWNRSVNSYRARGYSYERARELAATVAMLPNYSEHQTGLAVDLNGGSSCYNWLAEHCWEYGFILRYPEGKTDYTGVIHEPWHFRYVGTELALELRDLGLCMEEYMQMLTQKNG